MIDPLEVLPSPLAVRRAAVWLYNLEAMDERMSIESLDELSSVDAGSYLKEAEALLHYAATGKHLPKPVRPTLALMPSDPAYYHDPSMPDERTDAEKGEEYPCNECAMAWASMPGKGGIATQAEVVAYCKDHHPDRWVDPHETTAEWTRRMGGFPRRSE